LTPKLYVISLTDSSQASRSVMLPRHRQSAALSSLKRQ
jgi:hypothetical protein